RGIILPVDSFCYLSLVRRRATLDVLSKRLEMSRAQYAIPGHVPQSLRRPSRFDRVQRRTQVTVDFFHLDSVDSVLVDCVVNLLGTRGLDLIRAMPEIIIRAINDQVRKPIVRVVNVTDNPDISRGE